MVEISNAPDVEDRMCHNGAVTGGFTMTSRECFAEFAGFAIRSTTSPGRKKEFAPSIATYVAGVRSKLGLNGEDGLKFRVLPSFRDTAQWLR